MNLSETLLQYLKSTNSPLANDPERAARLAYWIERGVEVIAKLRSYRTNWRERFAESDILYHLFANLEAGNREEALWCAFLATHFGRLSAENPRQEQTTGKFYFGFGDRPYLMWDKVCTEAGRRELREWLLQHQAEISKHIYYGNHRKNESKQAKDIFAVLDSYLTWVRQNQSGAFTAPAHCRDAREVFSHLIDRVKRLERFGRLGAFDHLSMLQHFGLCDIEPGSTYLVGSTGPMEGAKKVWPDKTNEELLERRADRMAEHLGVPYQAVEDGLCNWNKEQDGGEAAPCQ